MNAVLRKEIRLLLPWWALAMVLTLAAAALGLPLPWQVACFGFGVVALSLAPFGQEIHFGTLSQILAQPESRPRLWQTKVFPVLASIFSVWLVMLASSRGKWEWLLWSELIAMALLSGGLWTTLLLRDVVAAFWVTIIVPLIMTMFPPENVAKWLLLAYSVAGFVCARRLFFQAQDIPWTGGTISFIKQTRRVAVHVKPVRPPGVFRALLGKEVRLQQDTLFLIACLVPVHAVALLLRYAKPNSIETSVLSAFVWQLWLAVPFVIGSVAVAEERKLGTLQPLLCAPVRRFWIFLLKLAFVLAAGLIFGAAIPWLIEHGAAALRIKTEIATGWFLLTASLAIALVSFFASTLSRNTLQAMGIGIILSLYVFLHMTSAHASQVFTFYSSPTHETKPLPSMVFEPALFIALLWPAWSNFKRIDLRGVFIGSVIRWGSTVALIMALAIATYVRPWEFFIGGEPAHGPARLSPDAVSQLYLSGDSVGALTKDGRIWTCSIQWENDGSTHPVQASAGFLPGDDWVTAGASGWPSFAIKRDGTLWEIWWDIRTSPGHWKMQRIGYDTDWKSLACNGWGLAALKTNGSLWFRILPRSPKPAREPVAGVMVPFGTGSDWVQIFPDERQGFVGVARDGATWSFGPSTMTLNATLNKNTVPSSIAAYGLYELPFRGTNWACLSATLGLDATGTVWKAGGHFAIPILRGCRSLSIGFFAAEVDERGHLTFQPLLREFEPKEYYGTGYIYNYPCLLGDWLPRTRHPSKYRDWIGASVQYNRVVALAADGTMSCWSMPYPSDAETSLLAPSRGPLWSLNIFNSTPQTIALTP